MILIAAFWAFLYANHNLETGMTVAVPFAIGAYVILLFGFLAWWLSRSAIAGATAGGRRRDGADLVACSLRR